MAAPEPRVFTIPAGTPFLPTLADALLDGTLTGGWPAGTDLADATIYLPTRRAGRALVHVLADRIAGRAALMPRIVPLGDIDQPEPGLDTDGAALPPIPPLERRMILARLVQAWSARTGHDGAGPVAAPNSPADALALAADLEALMDGLATEDVPWSALPGAVEIEVSRYFELTLDFVRIAHEAWPAILSERGASDPARRRNEALRAEAARLASGTAGPVIAAGSTGSIPAAAALIAAAARAPYGAAILPGLDTGLDAAAWDAIGGRAGTDPLWGHPQFMLRRLLAEHLKIGRGEVRVLGPVLHPHAPAEARRRFLSEAMRPAETTDAWAGMPPFERLGLASAGTEGLALIEAADEREEALAVAIALRETLADPGREAALVTPDRGLARRVAAELGRWGIAVEDSAGIPLAETKAGRLARLAAEAAAGDFEPVALLALLAHPDVTLGFDRARLERGAAVLEIGALRGPAPASGLAGITAALAHRRATRERRDPLPRQALSEADWDLAAAMLERLERAFAEFRRERTAGRVDLPALAARHAAALDELTDGADPEADRSHAALADLFEDLALAGDATGSAVSASLREYPAVFLALARDRSVPAEGRATHRRIRILGLLEARLLEVDRIVLGGLDEGIWPPKAESDAFLNRPMRLAIGLSPPERRIGQTAHDFAQVLGIADAILTRARKRDGKPTVPSRFLERMQAFAGHRDWTAMTARGARYLGLAAAIDAPRAVAPAQRPAPAAGRDRFPRRLSVTEIETLVRDPYGIFARHILRLTPLDPIAMPPNAADRGSMVHAILAEFAGAHPGALPDDARPDLIERAARRFAPIREAFPELHALWWPDFQRLVPHYLAWEASRRRDGPVIGLERYGSLEIPTGEGVPLVVVGFADRIEIAPGGQATIVDFKTGTVPSPKVVGIGFSPQLTLEAAMLQAGGFRDLAAGKGLPALLYVKLGGKDRLHGTEVGPHKDDARSLAEIVAAHVRGLERLARLYAGGAGYVSRPYPQYAKAYSAYDHLARVREWSLAGGDET